MQCLATASSDSNYQGLERESPITTVSSTDGVCKPQRAGFGGGEPYLTKIKYLGKLHYLKIIYFRFRYPFNQQNRMHLCCCV